MNGAVDFRMKMPTSSHFLAVTVIPGTPCKIDMPGCSALEIKHAALVAGKGKGAVRNTLECSLATQNFVLCSLPAVGGHKQARLGVVITNDPDQMAWLFLTASGDRAIHVIGRLVVSGGVMSGSHTKRRRAVAEPLSGAAPPPKRARRGNQQSRGAPLFMMRETLRCALAECIVCRAKIRTSAGERGVPSARPETCPRVARPRPRTGREELVGLYRRGQRILTVGDGDFSFSLALARALGGASLVATSHESLSSLRSVYGPACLAVLDELRSLGTVVAHGVDAADLERTLPAAIRPPQGFDAAVWNFPCVVRDDAGRVLPSERAGEGAAAAADARGSAELAANRSLVARFCAGATRLLNSSGEVHLTHKTGLKQWGLDELGGLGLPNGRAVGRHPSAAARGRDGGVGEQGATKHVTGLKLLGAVVFDRAAYPPYRPRKALADSSFPIGDAQTFVYAREDADGGPISGGGSLRSLCPLRSSASYR